MKKKQKNKKTQYQTIKEPQRETRVWIPAFLCCAEHHLVALL